MPDIRSDHIETLDHVLPEKTPLFVGLGVLIEGTITFKAEDPNQRLVILGEVKGDIYTNGILQVAQGATVHANRVISCREVVVAGKIIGDGVTIKTDLLILQATGDVHVDSISLPLGGLEHSRGGVLNGRLDMSNANEFRGDQFVPAPLALREVSAAVSAQVPAHGRTTKPSAFAAEKSIDAGIDVADVVRPSTVLPPGVTFVAAPSVPYSGVSLGEDTSESSVPAHG